MSIKTNERMSAVHKPHELVADRRGKSAEEATSRGERAPKILAAGGVLAALGMAACCVVPFALFTLGVSGAWIGNLTALKPYQPIFVALGAASIGYGFYLVYRAPKTVCEDGSYCASPRSSRFAKIGLWIATVLTLGALSFPYAVRYLLDT